MWIGLITTTLVMTIGFSLLLSGVEIERIRAKWPEKRCNIGIMFMAALYKPPEDDRTGTDFAKDNFQFCLSKIADQISVAFMTPFFNVLKGQIEALNVFGPIMNFLRATLGNVWGQIALIIREQYMKYKAIFVLFTKGYKHLEFAAGRINAIITAMLYSGLSLSVGLQNLFDYIVKVIMIIIVVLAIMVILLFFVLFPSIPIILAVITALVAAGVTAAASHRGAFCIDPDAQIRTTDGWKPLHAVRIGDRLWSPDDGENRVTGILTADAKTTPLVTIRGVRMSATHRVQSAGIWVLARDHPDAQSIPEHLPTLICLNTTKHTIRLKSSIGPDVLASDWEEVSDEEGQRAWTDLVRAQLSAQTRRYPTEVPLLSPETYVYELNRGWIPLSQVRLGDRISTAQPWDSQEDVEIDATTVLAIYEGEAHVDIGRHPWKSEGVWYYDVSDETHYGWTLAAPPSESAAIQRGRMLVTDKATFLLRRGTILELVRDFTELGMEHLESTYGVLDTHMNKQT